MKQLLQLSKEGFSFLSGNEGIELRPYKDSKSLWTIGLGHLLTQEELAKGILKIGDTSILFWQKPLTMDQALLLFQQDSKRFSTTLNTEVHPQLTQTQFDALFSFIFNIGVGGFLKSTVLARLNSGNFIDVPSAMMMWRKPPEIRTRRERECKLFKTGTYSHG